MSGRIVRIDSDDPDKPKDFVAYGKGFSGDYKSALEAAQVVQSNRTGAVYMRMDHVFAMVSRVQEAFGATAARLLQKEIAKGYAEGSHTTGLHY